MAAPAVARYLQDTTGISIKRVIRTLNTPTGRHHQPQRTPPPSRPPRPPEAENIPTTLNPNRTPKLYNSVVRVALSELSPWVWLSAWARGPGLSLPFLS